MPAAVFPERLAAQRARLKDIIRTRSFSEGAPTKLASGRVSTFYFNMKLTLSQPEALRLVGELVYEALKDELCDMIGGLEMGAVPVLNAVAYASADKRPLPLFWVRKQPKEHGAMQAIEGEAFERLAGRAAVVLEDVTTSGGSALKAIAAARSAGVRVAKVVTLVDRDEGAEDALRHEGIELVWLYRAGEFRS
jgi:orotate phosphoribosyltransferase